MAVHQQPVKQYVRCCNVKFGFKYFDKMLFYVALLNVLEEAK